MRLLTGAFVLAIAVSTPIAPGFAQAQSGYNVGMAVTDPAGGAVGTVIAIKGENVLVKTDKHEALLPKASFAARNGKLIFSLTQAQLNAEIEKNLAAANASIAPGATVTGLGGAQVGQIESIADGQATIALTSGRKLQLSETALRGNADGSVTIGYTADQLEALVAKASTADDAQTGGQPTTDGQ